MTETKPKTRKLGRVQQQVLDLLKTKKVGLTRNQIARYHYYGMDCQHKGYLTRDEAFNTWSVLQSLVRRDLVEQKEDKLWYLK